MFILIIAHFSCKVLMI